MSKKKVKVLCAMSGGVDSSVAAALLKQRGYDVVGVFMKFWSEPITTPTRSARLRAGPSLKRRGDSELNKCCSIESYTSAKKVAQILNIPLYTVNFKEAFKKKIVNNFLEEYQIGLTPNPCIRCNQFIKFGLLLKKAKQYGAEFVATGHYARIAQVKSKVTNSKFKTKKTAIKLLKGRDTNKDQSYFLYTLTQKQLQHILFPVGGYIKLQVRELARKFKLPVAEKSESQELCFINEKDHYGFLQRNLKPVLGNDRGLKKGDIVTAEGQKIGEHQGLPLYTIGQRRGIEVGGTGPYYVVELDFKHNKLIVADDNEHPRLFRDSLICKKVHWISGTSPELPLECKVRVRYRQEEVEATVTPLTGGAGGGYLVKFKKPQRAITPGQSAVFYQEDEVLGGGIIANF